MYRIEIYWFQMASPRSTRDAKADSAELVLLSVLADGPLYGYAITKRVAARSDGAMSMSAGVLYPLLHSLEKQGLIVAEWETIRSDRREEDDDSEGRRRKWYRLSPKGRRRLEQRIEAHQSYIALMERFLKPAEEAAG
jgi:PadR family transcriptional regulator, regulatory protein PadR